jgi:uncharacterized membrane protein YqjE
MEAGSGRRSSFGITLKRVSASLLQGFEDRLHLFALELQEEKRRTTRLLLAGLLAALAAFSAFLCLNLILLLAFWDTYRLPVASGLFVFYLVAALALALFVRRRMRRTTPPFSATLEELRKDRAALSGDDS